MRQQTLAEASFQRYRKPTRRERFLAEMDQVITWSELCGAVLSQGRRRGSAVHGAGTDAVHPFSAVLVVRQNVEISKPFRKFWLRGGVCLSLSK